MKEPRADAKLKKLPEKDQEDLWVLLNPQDGSTPLTLAELRSEVERRHEMTCSLSTLSEWRAWYAMRRRTERAKARADQARLEWKAENPDASPAELEELGQMVFTSEAIEDGNAKVFVALMRERSKRLSLQVDVRKLALLEQAAEEAKRKLEDATMKAKRSGGISEETLAEIEAAANLL